MECFILLENIFSSRIYLCDIYSDDGRCNVTQTTDTLKLNITTFADIKIKSKNSSKSNGKHIGSNKLRTIKKSIFGWPNPLTNRREKVITNNKQTPYRSLSTEALMRISSHGKRIRTN